MCQLNFQIILWGNKWSSKYVLESLKNDESGQFSLNELFQTVIDYCNLEEISNYQLFLVGWH